MTTELWVALLVLLGFAIYVAAKVLGAMRKSREQWQQVDKSKLKDWKDEDEW